MDNVYKLIIEAQYILYFFQCSELKNIQNYRLKKLDLGTDFTHWMIDYNDRLIYR